jgi:hypothetical protein
MGGHVGVASPTHLPVPRCPRWHTLAPHTARATRPVAHVWPRVKTASLLAQTSTIYKPTHKQSQTMGIINPKERREEKR